MFPLFKSQDKSLADFFKTLTDSDIQNCCERRIYLRGIEYFDEGLITDAVHDSATNLFTAKVAGGEPYSVSITLENGHVSASCSCPYDEVCKHIVTVLLYIENERRSKKPIDINVAKNIFRKVESDIQKMFTNWPLMSDPIAFDLSLTNSFSKLSGLEIHLSKEIASLIFYIVESVSGAIDEEYLYDKYNDHTYEPSKTFINLISKYTRALPPDEKRIFLEQLEEELDKNTSPVFIGLRRKRK